MIEFLSQDWPWYVAGPLIGLVMLLLNYFDGYFGVSSNLRTICSMLGAGKNNNFFNVDIKANSWNLIFLLGSIIGGFIANTVLDNGQFVDISAKTISRLTELGFSFNGETYLPNEIFGIDALKSIKGLFILLFGGILVGFGTRYAGGCTSGHSISGLANLQIPSLIASIGFFLGGLIMTHFLLPLIF